MIIEIFTDGACRGNPGPGGWAAVLCYGGHIKKISGAISFTTNNRMELTAVINALKILKKPMQVKLITDSQYVKQGITNWITKWKCNNWKNNKKKSIKNIDLWMELDSIVQYHKITWYWVKGHNNCENNIFADKLANEAIDGLKINAPNYN